MNDFKISTDKGRVVTIRAVNKSTAIRLFCEAEGCTSEWFCKHCTVRRIRK